ncbi:MAG: Spo0B domain-containing protein [Bacillaceae bacterium]|nr:Spo0B domain-containing protein [Bacillaceae bacterium]
MTDEGNRYSEELIMKLLSEQRHDWLNHLQVIISYLKMGREEQAVTYIQELTRELSTESRVAHLGYPPLVIYILLFNTLHPQLKMEVEIPGPFRLEQLPVAGKEIYGWIRGICEVYHDYSSAETEPDSLYLTICKRDQDVLFSVDYEGNLKDEQASEQLLKKWIERINLGGGQVVTFIHNGQESVIEWKVKLSQEVHA